MRDTLLNYLFHIVVQVNIFQVRLGVHKGKEGEAAKRLNIRYRRNTSVNSAWFKLQEYCTGYAQELVARRKSRSYFFFTEVRVFSRSEDIFLLTFSFLSFLAFKFS